MDLNMVFHILMLIGSALLGPGEATTSKTTTTRRTTITTVTSPAPSGKDLTGKMFTLSRSSGSVSFYPPTYAYSLDSAPMYWTTSRPTSSWTTVKPSPTRGVSVCVRFVADFNSGDVNLFTLSPSSTPLSVAVSSTSRFTLTFNNYNNAYFSVDKLFVSLPLDTWSSVCLTFSSVSKVVQVFNGSQMSIRRVLSNQQFQWSGEPVLKFPGFDGQLSDVQVWDYPLTFSEVYDYMAFSRWSRGSVLSWSSIAFYTTGSALLEDSFYPNLQRKLNAGAERKDMKRKKNRLIFRVEKFLQDNQAF
ncbi:C-reactive protein-like [Gouania willdenowi]|uniref:C-reactive protein-like n=1 Tax=Gouania willdenowi TaxID=441366 RepID=A0A8C5D6E9_GOUWI|nr:C-reactive protein-like [Gouania willdenowi]